MVASREMGPTEQEPHRANEPGSPPPAQARSVPAARLASCALVATLGCGLDLITKQLAFSWLRAGEVRWLVPGYAGFQLSLNEGAVFGLGQGSQAWLAAFSVVAAAGIAVWLVRFDGAADWGTTLVLGAILGGVLGNLFDRLGLHGLAWGRDWPLPVDRVRVAGEAVYAVRDWVLLQAGDQLRWPNFNFADTLLVLGVGWLLLRGLRRPAGDPAGASA